MKDPWNGYIEPVRIWGGLYFVGTMPASTHIIDTGEGLIMIDSGYQESLYIVIHNMYKIGLNPMDIKYIVHTHGHIDHLGATRALTELTGAKTFIGAEDRDYANGKLDLTWAKELGLEYNGPFEPDVLIKDGSQIKLGNTVIDCVATPGHSPGAMSFFFDVTENGRKYRVGLPGGMGINSMQKEFLDRYGLSYDCRDKFVMAMDRLMDIKVDIFLGNHAHHNNTKEKAEMVRGGNQEAFVNPDEWGLHIIESKQALIDMVKNEKNS
ncbi:MAG: MBL fold metallo-hydrolase [Clostridia bacterium]|nr:MBL fold metallo-hydrolase [Clostridia bacterium]